MNPTIFHVALCDAQKAFRDLTRHYLESKGNFLIDISVSTGEDLIQLLEKAELRPDVCIIDLHQPACGGYKTIKYLHDRWQLKCLASAGVHDDFPVAYSVSNGAYGYFSKSHEPATIDMAVRAICEHGHYFSNASMNIITPSVLKKGKRRDEKMLTENEVNILSLCCCDLCYKEIADSLKLSVRTVENIIARLMERRNLRSKAGVIQYAIHNCLGVA